MCIYEPGHIRCRVRLRTRCRFRPDPPLRFAALRGRVFEPRFEPRPSQAPGSLRPCGVRVKGAAALGRRSPTRPRRFLAPGGEAFLGSPCRGSLRCAALGRHARPSSLSATSGSDAGQRRSASPPHLDADPSRLRAGEKPAHAAQTPCKRFWRTFTPSPHSRKGPALKGAQNGLERLLGIPAQPDHLRSGRGSAATPRNVTTFTSEMPASICIAPSIGVQ